MTGGAPARNVKEAMMKDISALTAAQLLAIPLDQPERLFSPNLDSAHREYRKLASMWHPRVLGDDGSVSTHVNALYDLAVKRLNDGTWQTPGEVTWTATDGRKWKLRFRKKKVFELGTMYIGDEHVAYELTRDNDDLYDAAKARMRSFKYANDKMRSEVERYLPKIRDEIETADVRVMVIKKTPDLFTLADVVEQQGGRLDSKHVAWVISSLLNLSCYLKYAGIVHNDISPDTYFVSPEHHSGALLGGWWYSRKDGERLVALPARTMQDIDPDVLRSKTASHAVDSELVKLTGREALGSPLGSVLLKEKAAPPAILSWLNMIGTNNVFDEYKQWYEKVLKSSFGKRKFVELKVSADDIYTP